MLTNKIRNKYDFEIVLASWNSGKHDFEINIMRGEENDMKKEHETCKGGETMKFTKKKVLVTSLAISIIAILSFGTIAWFTAEDSVTNKFYVGDTDTEADEVFGIDLWENRDTNGDGDYK